MKYVFIAGLEHSGTTLINHLIAQHPNAIALGEVSSFFSSSHMRQYMEKWGDCSDVRLCSCAKDWEKCEFWGQVRDLNGLHSDASIKKKYTTLISTINSNYSDQVVIIDSSKSLSTLKILINNRQEIGINEGDFHVVFMVKDVRSFTASIFNKKDSNRSLLNYIRTFNWWLNVNKTLTNYLVEKNISFSSVLYETMCSQPEKVMLRIFDSLRLDAPNGISLQHNHSHISMGNKNFILRNSSRIRYDNRWFLEDGIQLAYLLHYTARCFNRKLYKMQSGAVSKPINESLL